MLTTSVKKATPVSTDRAFADLGTNTASGMVADGNGNIYVTSSSTNVVLKVTYPGGVVTTFAGSGSAGFVNGTGTGASFNAPGPIAIDSSSNLYIGDTSNDIVRKITTGQVVSTVQFNVPGIRSLAVSPNGSNMAAVDSSSNVRYYLTGADVGKPTGASSPITDGVACRPDGVFYRIPSQINYGPALVRLSVSTAGSSSEAIDSGVGVSLTNISGTMSNVSMFTPDGVMQNFVAGDVVSLSGFTPSALNVSGVTLVSGTSTGNQGRIKFLYDFGQTLLGSYSTNGTVTKVLVTETANQVTGFGGNPPGFLTFVSQTQAVVDLSGLKILTFTGDTASVTASTILTGYKSAIVKNALLPEFIYGSLNWYAKQY